jgi:outer membrane protein OmpA-like peptidoglycan-associated protein
MRSVKNNRRGMALLTCVLIVSAASASSGFAQTTVTTDKLINQLAGLETPVEIDVVALRQQAAERIKAKAKTDAAPQKRPPITDQLSKLPQFVADIKFDPDTSVIRPESYRLLGQIADALYHPTLVPYKFLIVGHTESTGRRENNLILSQRRADAIRDVLVNTFKISAKRFHTLGLGEEQMQDSNRPSSSTNQQVQLVTVGLRADMAPSSEAAAAPRKENAKNAKKKKSR